MRTSAIIASAIGVARTPTHGSWRPVAENPAGVIALEARRSELIAMLGPALLDALETRADLHRLDGIDAHHGARQIRIETFEHRLAQSGRHAFGGDGDASADRVARFAQPPDQILQLFDPARVRTEEWIVVGARRLF